MMNSDVPMPKAAMASAMRGVRVSMLRGFEAAGTACIFLLQHRWVPVMVGRPFAFAGEGWTKLAADEFYATHSRLRDALFRKFLLMIFWREV